MSRYVVTATWDDAPHLSEAAKAELWASIPPYQRDARSKGIPQLGSGAIYPVPEIDIVCDPFEFPAWYRHVYALDVGWNRTAALWGAYSEEDDTLYVYAEYYRSQAEPAIHAAAIQARGAWISGVIDPASRGRSQRDGEQLFATYRALGLVLVPAINAVDAGLYETWGRLSTGRIRIFRTLQNFWTEYRLYRRDEHGKVVKVNDHLMDCLRYMVMSGIDVAVIRPFEQWPGRPGLPQLGARRGLESDYKPMADAWNVSRDTERQTRQSWLPGQSTPWLGR